MLYFLCEDKLLCVFPVERLSLTTLSGAAPGLPKPLQMKVTTSLSFACYSSVVALTQSETLFLHLLDCCLIPSLSQDGEQHICLTDCCGASASS